MKRGRASKRSRVGAEPDLVRFGISIPADLLKTFDEHLGQQQAQNRSEAIRDLIRDKLIQDAWAAGKAEQVATVTLVYDIQNAEVQRRLIENKRGMREHLLTAFQLRLSPTQEMEVVALRGPAADIRTEAEALIGLKGILHGKLAMTSPAAP